MGRGSSLKRVIHVYLNSNKIFSYEPKQYSQSKLSIPLFDLNGENIILIEGFGIVKNFSFNRSGFKYNKSSMVSNSSFSNYNQTSNISFLNSNYPSFQTLQKKIFENSNKSQNSFSSVKISQVEYKEKSYLIPFGISISLLFLSFLIM